MRVTPLGTAAAGIPDAGNAGAGYLLEEGDDRLLLDCGNGVLGNLARHVGDYDELDGLLLSHLHFDHVLDIVPLALRFHYYGTVLPVHGPPGTRELLEALLPLFSANPGKFLDALELHPWTPGREVEVAGFHVTPLHVVHDTDAYALRVERDGRVLAYSGDTRACEGLEAAARGAHVLLSEATIPSDVDWENAAENHLGAPEAARVAREAGVERLILTHMLYDTAREDALRAAREIFPDVQLATVHETIQV